MTLLSGLILTVYRALFESLRLLTRPATRSPTPESSREFISELPANMVLPPEPRLPITFWTTRFSQRTEISRRQKRSNKQLKFSSFSERVAFALSLSFLKWAAFYSAREAARRLK